jgi:hypothetical protein
MGSAPNPGSSLAGTPSRSSIGAHLQLLEDAGYKTAIVGKWQLSERDFQASFHFGFEEYLLWHFGMRVIGVQTPGSQGSRYWARSCVTRSVSPGASASRRSGVHNNDASGLARRGRQGVSELTGGDGVWSGFTLGGVSCSSHARPLTC